jgi:hypothetical protein
MKKKLKHAFSPGSLRAAVTTTIPESHQMVLIYALSFRHDLLIFIA